MRRLTRYYAIELCSVNRGLNAFPKSIDPCQPAQFAQADMGRDFLLSLKW